MQHRKIHRHQARSVPGRNHAHDQNDEDLEAGIDLLEGDLEAESDHLEGGPEAENDRLDEDLEAGKGRLDEGLEAVIARQGSDLEAVIVPLEEEVEVGIGAEVLEDAQDREVEIGHPGIAAADEVEVVVVIDAEANDPAVDPVVKGKDHRVKAGRIANVSGKDLKTEKGIVKRGGVARMMMTEGVKSPRNLTNKLTSKIHLRLKKRTRVATKMRRQRNRM